ncbi:MAG: lytic transglycosylase domain-containing protein [Sphingomonadaceae bacterium]
MKLSRLTVIAYTLAACGASGLQAQEFQVFDHGLGQSEMPRTSLDENWSSQSPDGAHAPQPSPRRSFREALYEPLIRQAEIRYQLPPRLLQALVWQESRFDPMAISSAGAAGLAQLMPATARELGVANRHDPGQSIDGGARYLRKMLDRFGAIHLALAAYNAGPGAVSRAGGIPRNRETPGYVRSVLRRWMAYSAI